MIKSTSSAAATTRIRRTCEVPPRPRRPARRATAPRRRRDLYNKGVNGPIPPEIGQLTKLTELRVPPASPTPGEPRDRPSTSQVPLLQQDRRPDPARDRPAHEAEGPASSPRVPDARRAARPPLGVAGASTATGSPARSRPRSASSRSWGSCEFPPRPRRPASRATDLRRRRQLYFSKIDGPIPPEIGLLTKLKELRVPPASPDARRAARPPLGVAGASTTTRSPARSRPRSASSRS